MHYTRKKRTGDCGEAASRMEHRIYGTVEERFWAKVHKTETCWLWTAKTSADGYGHFLVGGSMRGAHRVAYELIVGPIPE